MLYEMLVGDPPYLGSTAQAIVAKVLTEKPVPVTVHRDTVPANVAAAIQKALNKLPADRFATAAEFAKALTTPGWSSGEALTTQLLATPGAPRASRDTRWRTLAVAASVVALASLGIAVWVWRRPVPPQPVVRYSLGLPPTQTMRQGVLGVNIAFSPDGKRMVYVGPGDGGDQLWVRERDHLDATPLPGTIGASNPFFSPDGRRIGYSATLNVELRIVPVTGGPPITLANPGVGAGGGGAWGADGWIYFDDARNGLSRIRADGGIPELTVPLDSTAGELGAAWPDVLPNGKAVVFRSRRSMTAADFEIVAYDLASKRRHVLGKGLMARYVAPGYLVFLRSDGAMMAAAFDQDALEFTGPAVPLFEGVMTKSFGSADVAISRTGTLAYVPGVAASSGGVAEVVIVSRDGAITQLKPPLTYNPVANRALNVSPDGRRVALDVLGATAPDLWVKQLPDGPFSRLTFDTRNAMRPRWTPDGRSLLYIATRDSSPESVWLQKADGSSAAEQLWRVPGRPIAEASLSRDGQWLVYRVVVGSGNRDVYGIRLGRDSVPVPLLTGAFQEQAAALSPDGKWLAYTSNESGRDEIFVRPFPNTSAGRWQVSTTGGSAARWAHSGRELFYEAPAGDMMSVPVTPGATFAPGAPRRLFPYAGGLLGSNVVPYYDLLPDDQHFLMGRMASVNQAPGAGQLVVVEHWLDELKEKMAAR
ncbi:MAG: hypothetical protein ACJ8B6_04275 [Gemmatimonadales bacterium]